MATASTPTPNLSLTSLSGMKGIPGATTTNLETIGAQAPTSIASLDQPSITPITSALGGPPDVNPPTTLIAYLTQPSTTLTAYGIPQSSHLAAVLQYSGTSTTLNFRQEGVTLEGGVAVSLGYDGLVESTTTAFWMPTTVTGSGGSGGTGVSLTSGSSVALPTGPGPVIFNSTTLTSSQSQSQTGMVTMTSSQSQSSGEGGGSSDSGASATDQSASSTDAAATLSAGKAALVIGAVGGIVGAL